jgi:pimeloyl-ACP methyl ester carboxylesterase
MTSPRRTAARPAGFTERFAKVNGVRLRYLVGGHGSAGGTFLIEQAKLVASDVRSQVVTGAGHWLMEEAPDTVIPAISEFVV